FRFMRLNGDSTKNVLITGDTGEHLFISDPQLRELLSKRLRPGTSLYKDLLARHFIYEPGRHDPLPEMAAQY
ncbi:His-Xaa-Ser system radical SAM maturase HxsB, partial [Pseudomonas aeruginosa]